MYKFILNKLIKWQFKVKFNKNKNNKDFKKL